MNCKQMGLKKGLGIILLFFLLVLLAYYSYTKFYTCAIYSCLIFPDLNLWKVTDVYESNSNYWSGLVTHPNYQVRLHIANNVSAEKAFEFTKIEKMKIDGLFETTNSPYPSSLSDKITCSDKLKPKETELTSKYGQTISYFTSYLNDRMQYGVCTDSQIAFRVYSGMFYCKDVDEWFQIEVIKKMNNVLDDSAFKNLFLNTGCQRPSLNTGKLFP